MSAISSKWRGRWLPRCSPFICNLLWCMHEYTLLWLAFYSESCFFNFKCQSINAKQNATRFPSNWQFFSDFSRVIRTKAVIGLIVKKKVKKKSQVNSTLVPYFFRSTSLLLLKSDKTLAKHAFSKEMGWKSVQFSPRNRTHINSHANFHSKYTWAFLSSA